MGSSYSYKYIWSLNGIDYSYSVRVPTKNHSKKRQRRDGRSRITHDCGLSKRAPAPIWQVGFLVDSPVRSACRDRAGRAALSAAADGNLLGEETTARPSPAVFPGDAAVRLAPSSGLARTREPGGLGQAPSPRYPGPESRGCDYPPVLPPAGAAPAAPRASRRQECLPPRSPARVVSVRSWLAAPRGNSLSFRPLRISTPVIAASSSARSRERLHEPGPGAGPVPAFGPQLTPERLPPDATGPECSAAVDTATKPAAAISRPTTTLPAGCAHARLGWWVGGERDFQTPDLSLDGQGCGALHALRRLTPPPRF